MAMYSVRAAPNNAVGDGVTDDTMAIYNTILQAMGLTAPFQPGCVYFPAGRYLIKDANGLFGSQNIQNLTISGQAPSFFTLTISVGTAPDPVTHNGGTLVNYTTAAISWSSDPNSNASQMQSKLNAAGIAATVTYVAGTGPYPLPTTYKIVFPNSLGAPVITANTVAGYNPMAFSAVMIQSGAALFLVNYDGLRFVGDGIGDPNDPPGTYSEASRSAVVWGGTANGIMFDFHGCANVKSENLAFYGQQNATGATNTARTGVLFSANPGFGGTALTLMSCLFSRFMSRTPVVTGGTAALAGALQFGMAVGDGNSDTGRLYDCFFFNDYAVHGFDPNLGSAIGNAILIMNSQSVVHHVSGISVGGFDTAFYVNAGGNLVVDSAAMAVNTILRLGTSYPLNSAGGESASVFMLRNVRAEAPDVLGGQLSTLVHADYMGENTIVITASTMPRQAGTRTQMPRRRPWSWAPSRT